MDGLLYYEDFIIGQEFHSKNSYTIDKDKAVAFSSEYDPHMQPFYDEGSKDTLPGKLTVSSWQTASITMRLKSETGLFNVAGGLVGMGLENVRWPRPTVSGDSLRVVVTILESRLSKSRPGNGIIKYKVETFNQRDELAMEMCAAVIVRCRNAES